MLELYAIASVDQNWGIGDHGKLLIHNRDDMDMFGRMTTGQVVIMGHKTLQGLSGGKPLRNRHNIVMTRQEVKGQDNLFITHSVSDVICRIKYLNRYNYAWVIGGESIYRQLLPYCTTALITKHWCTRPADAHFPDLDKLPNWHFHCGSDVQQITDGPDAGIEYRFITYVNDQPLALPA